MLTDMQKFPLRMKDNDLLVTELYKDPSGNRITALSVYLTQKASQCVCVTCYFANEQFVFLQNLLVGRITVSLHLCTVL